MRECNMDKQEMEQLLSDAETRVLALSGEPYAVPVNFLYSGGFIYIHGQMNGEKAARIRANKRVCVTVFDDRGVYAKPNAKTMCNVSTHYSSVVIQGEAQELFGERKTEALRELTRKFRPQMLELPINEKVLAVTSVFEIASLRMTGKRR